MSIKPSTPVVVTLATFATIAACLIGATWKAANTLGAIREELSAIRREVSDVARDRWTVRDQERWAFELERQNRELRLAVPVVPQRNLTN